MEMRHSCSKTCACPANNHLEAIVCTGKAGDHGLALLEVVPPIVVLWRVLGDLIEDVHSSPPVFLDQGAQMYVQVINRRTLHRLIIRLEHLNILFRIAN